MARMLLIIALITIATAVKATIYKTVDEHGNTIYTDEPPINKPAEEVKIKQPFIIPAEEIKAPIKVTKDKAKPYKTLEIISPKDQATFRNTRSISLTVKLEPELQSNDKIRLRRDGKVIGTYGNQLTFQLTDLDRGSHSAQVEVINSEGKVLKSASVTFYIHQHSVRHSGQPAKTSS